MGYQFLDRNTRLPSNAADIRRRLDANDDWWMTDAERLALTGLLAGLRPDCAIELGVYRAGSLTVLSQFCRKVYALDIDPACEEMFRDAFRNVEFVTGPSEHTLPVVLARIEAAREPLGFVLIDADHRREMVQRDIESVLRYTPTRPLYLLVHDSFNPDCRSGIKGANWSASPHVHAVELDFVVGRFFTDEDPGSYRQMWCGFALAILLPEERTEGLIIHENESLMFNTARRHSVFRRQRWWNPVHAAADLKYHARCLLRRRAPAVYDALRRLRSGAR